MIYILLITIIILPLTGSICFEPLIPLIPDWDSKNFLAIIFSCGFIYLIQHDIGKVHNMRHNPWVHSIIPLSIISIYNAPPIKLMNNGVDLGGLWMYKAVFWVLLYYFFHISLLRIDFSDKEYQNLIGKCFAGD